LTLSHDVAELDGSDLDFEIGVVSQFALFNVDDFVDATGFPVALPAILSLVHQFVRAEEIETASNGVEHLGADIPTDVLTIAADLDVEHSVLKRDALVWRLQVMSCEVQV
jgi:hypothetical protein